jgi:hypothetical protein
MAQGHPDILQQEMTRVPISPSAGKVYESLSNEVIEGRVMFALCVVAEHPLLQISMSALAALPVPFRCMFLCLIFSLLEPSFDYAVFPCSFTPPQSFPSVFITTCTQKSTLLIHIGSLDRPELKIW